MSDTTDIEARRQRSPSSPFISLKRAVERTVEFEDAFKRYAARPADVVKKWGYESKSSGGLQTIAALKAFGLLDDVGTGDTRKLKLSDLAIRLLGDKRPGARERALAEAAMKPRLISEYRQIWNTGRPDDDHCISELTIDRNFTPETAKKFLYVFDETIAFADLAGSDKIEAGAQEVFRDSGSGEGENEQPPDPLSLRPPAGQRRVPIMEGERVVFTEEGQPNQYLKLIASGEVDDGLLEALADFVKRQRKRLGLTPLPPPAFGKPIPTLIGQASDEDER